jgi:hypothetical protein
MWNRAVGGIFLSAIVAVCPSHAEDRSGTPSAPLEFNIPAQPLAKALVAYGAKTGFEIFYNAALAEAQQSAAVVGVFSRQSALQQLLRGTGYVARSTGPETFTIVTAPPATTAVAAETRRRLQPYFAALQIRIDEAMCRRKLTAKDELLLQFWLSSSGLVTRAEVIGDDGHPTEDQSSAEMIRGLALAAPPAGLPQPINMVVFPSTSGSPGCRHDQTPRRASFVAP